MKVFVALLSIIVGAFIWFYNPYKSRIERLEKEIPHYALVEIDDQISSVVDSFFIERGFIYIKLTNDHKVALRPSRNHIYEPAFIGDQLKVGHHIIKNSGSDTLALIMDKDIMVFRLGKIINE